MSIYRAQHSGSLVFRANSDLWLHRLLFRLLGWGKAYILFKHQHQIRLHWQITSGKSPCSSLRCDRVPVAVATCEGNFLREPWLVKCSCCGPGGCLLLTAWTEAVGLCTEGRATNKDTARSKPLHLFALMDKNQHLHIPFPKTLHHSYLK